MNEKGFESRFTIKKIDIFGHNTMLIINVGVKSPLDLNLFISTQRVLTSWITKDLINVKSRATIILHPE